MKGLNLIIKKAVCEIRFYPTPVYYDKKTVVWSKFRKHFPDWNVNYTELELSNKQKEMSFKATSRNAVFIRENLSVFSNFTDLGYRLLRDYIKDLEIASINRIGVRIFYLHEAKGTFEDLNNLMVQKLFSFLPDKTILTDMAYILNFDQEDYHFHFALGPVTEKESKERLNMEKGIFPKLSVFFDVDIFKKKFSPDLIDTFLRKSCEKSNEITQQFSERIFS